MRKPAFKGGGAPPCKGRHQKYEIKGRAGRLFLRATYYRYVGYAVLIFLMF
jgi:hypothetical protein